MSGLLTRCSWSGISDSLTVEFSRTPGQSFHRKAMQSVIPGSTSCLFISILLHHSRHRSAKLTRSINSALKIQMHRMLLDTGFNSTRTVMVNLRAMFEETAIKCFHYIRCLPRAKRPNDGVLKSEFPFSRPCSMSFGAGESRSIHWAGSALRIG